MLAHGEKAMKFEFSRMSFFPFWTTLQKSLFLLCIEVFAGSRFFLHGCWSEARGDYLTVRVL